MKNDHESVDKMISSLEKRSRELDCLYRVDEILAEENTDLKETCQNLVENIGSGWQYPLVCMVKIIIDEETYHSEHFEETPWVQVADIRVQDRVAGTISVYYSEQMPQADEGPFLKDERRMIQTIADRMGTYILNKQMKRVYRDWSSPGQQVVEQRRGDWQVILDLLWKTDKNLFVSLSHKMLNYLCWSGVEEAEELIKSASLHQQTPEDELLEVSNRPYEKQSITFPIDLSDEVFKIAARHMSDEEIISRLQKWIQEDKLTFLSQVVNRNLSLSAVADAIRRYYHSAPDEGEYRSPRKKGIRVSLIRRFLSEQLEYINIAKDYVDIGDFYELIKNTIFTTESHGKLGGKSAGIYLAAQIIRKAQKPTDGFITVKIPKTWYITSDMSLHFMHFNNLDDIVEQKYKEIDEVRFEYPHIIHSFKNSHFPPEMVKGLSVALDDFGDHPLIVRSSSLLEDRMGAAFSGKYKSVFLANQGSKQRRLDSLLDAVAEVYASTFGPDPVEYRTERGLIDFAEEMGIMIQEVVGSRVGDYFLPSFAGVAFSRNEFRWSSRIKREDGLVRLVPGLGTRAVDRLSDDYPALFAPGQPGLRVNQSIEDILRYSPRRADVINLKTNRFETVEMNQLLREYGFELPLASKLVSIHKDGHISRPIGTHVNFEEDDLPVTFDGLISSSPFIKQIHTILHLLEDKMHTPVDIEFAHDGKDLYLLQCRPQSYSDADISTPIPRDIADDKVVFSAKKYVSNGRVPDITHIVYVDPDKYGKLADRADLVKVGRTIGRLNQILPKRQFVLMGPGRWGSRGDIKLGVKVGYSDINNAAMLIEIARTKGNYTPDLSFGTHFFQDLVEAHIRYLPLYPDDDGILFNEELLLNSENILAQVAPESASLANTVRLIDVPASTGGMILRVLMNADLDEAMGILSQPASPVETTDVLHLPDENQPEINWRWRLQMAEYIASELDPKRFGLKGCYLFGSTKNAAAGVASDIDILIHFSGTKQQRLALEHWLEGWSLSLDQINFLRTGYRSGGLLDVHIVTDEDIANKTSYAVKIDATTDPARPLRMKGQTDTSS